MSNYNITITRGDTLTFGVKFEGVDMVDTAFFSCKKNQYDTDYIFKKALKNGIDFVENGVYRVRVAPSDTAELDVGIYYYDLEIRKNGDVFTVLKGHLKIEQGITEG